MTYCYDLFIANLVFRIESPKEMQFADCFQPFLMAGDSSSEPDVRITVTLGIDTIKLNETYQRITPNIFKKDNQIVRRFYLREGMYLYRVEFSNRGNLIQLYVPSQFGEIFCNKGNLLIYLELERILISFNRVILHASAVIHNEQVYVFSAPSGSGKSTHAVLWEMYGGAEILNGDKVILEIGSNGCKGYGSPVAGSSSIYKNMGKRIEAITFLRKGNSNQIITEKKSKEFFSLYSEMIKSSWDQDFNQKLLDYAEEIMKKTQIIFFSCTDKKEAVMCLKEHLERVLHEKKNENMFI